MKTHHLKRLVLGLIFILSVSLFLQGCGGKPSFVGKWQVVKTEDKGWVITIKHYTPMASWNGFECMKDGTGLIYFRTENPNQYSSDALTWKVLEGNQIVLSGEQFSYEFKDGQLVLHYLTGSARFFSGAGGPNYPVTVTLQRVGFTPTYPAPWKP